MYGEQQVIYMQSNLALLSGHSGIGSKFKLEGACTFRGILGYRKGTLKYFMDAI